MDKKDYIKWADALLNGRLASAAYIKGDPDHKTQNMRSCKKERSTKIISGEIKSAS